ERPDGAEARRDEPAWQPPSLPPLPAMVDPSRQSLDERAVMLSLATPMHGQPFVPGLYRILARWPGFLAHIATVLPPRLEDGETERQALALLDRIDAEVPRILAGLPPLPGQPPMPPSPEFGPVLEALETYRKTSPEMVVAG